MAVKTTVGVGRWRCWMMSAITSQNRRKPASEPRPQATLVCQGWSELARWIGLARCIVEQLSVACIDEHCHQLLCGFQLGRPPRLRDAGSIGGDERAELAIGSRFHERP